MRLALGMYKGCESRGAGETVVLGKSQCAYSKQEVETLRQVLALGQILTHGSLVQRYLNSQLALK